MLPRLAYVDDAVLRWERQHFFDGRWVCAGRGDGLAWPGAQTAVRLGSTSVLLTRDDASVLHALANICRHRGHELVACGAAAAGRVIRCPYHGWSYELDGSLHLAPGFDDGLDRATSGLARLAATEWAGWVFVDVSGTAAPLPDQLGSLAWRVGPWDCGRLVVAATHRYEVRANWKLVIENFHECYHCPMIHPELCRVSPSHSGRNYRDEPGAWIGGEMELAAGAETMSLDGRSGAGPLRRLDDRQRRHVLYVQLFPNLMLSLHPDYVMTHRVEPVTATTTHVECQWLFPPEVTARSDFDPSYAVDFWDLVNRQDWRAVESVQRSLESPKFTPGPLGPSEDAVYQFVTMVAAGYLGQPLVPGSVDERRLR
jgi:phenylpropionate dioxygenase-like ring-hydroxylating dioxygenase large terminal subunit